MKKLIALSVLAVLVVPTPAQASATEGTTECTINRDGKIWFTSRLHTFGYPLSFEFEGRKRAGDEHFIDMWAYRVVLDAVSGGDWIWSFRSDPRATRTWVYRLWVREGDSRFRTLIAYWKWGQTSLSQCGSSL